MEGSLWNSTGFLPFLCSFTQMQKAEYNGYLLFTEIYRLKLPPPGEVEPEI